MTSVASELGIALQPHDLAFGVISRAGGGRTLAVRFDRHVLDCAAAAAVVDLASGELLRADTLSPLLAAGPTAWRSTIDELASLLSDGRRADALRPHLLSAEEVVVELAFEVADYVDFYASEHHAAAVGRILRPGTDPLPSQWKTLPICYHGRAGTVVATGTPIRRPRGLRILPGGTDAAFRPSERLDFEAEVGFVVGIGSELGHSVACDELGEHVFGVVLVNDWSARDIQAFEYVPLGPMLGKSFATSISGWVVPLSALEAARCEPPPRRPAPPPHLADPPRSGYRIDLEVSVNETVVSRPPFAAMYWTAAQQLAHLTSNGAAIRTGDLFASGTVSGPSADEAGSLIELSFNGTRPIALADGSQRGFLEDHAEVVITASAPGPSGTSIELGEVRGRISSSFP